MKSQRPRIGKSVVVLQPATHFSHLQVDIGVGDGEAGSKARAPQIWENFSGKHHVIFGQLIFLEEGRTGTLYF